MEDKFKILRNAERFVVNRQFDRAIAEYQKLLQTHEDPSVLNTMGDLCLRSGRRSEALDCFPRVAAIFVQSGFVAKGIAIYRKVEELSPGNRDVLAQLGELYERRGLRSEALRYWNTLAEEIQTAEDGESLPGVRRRIVDLDPENPAAHVALAQALSIQSPSEAMGEYLAAARLYLEKGGPEEARDTALKALELDRANLEAKRLFRESEDRLGAAAATADVAVEAPAETAEADVPPSDEVPWGELIEDALETPRDKTPETLDETPAPLNVETFEEGGWDTAVEPAAPETANADAPLSDEAPWGEMLEDALETPRDEAPETLDEVQEPTRVETFEEGTWAEAFGTDHARRDLSSPGTSESADEGDLGEALAGWFAEDLRDDAPPLEDTVLESLDGEAMPSGQREVVQDGEGAVQPEEETVGGAVSRSKADAPTSGERLFDGGRESWATSVLSSPERLEPAPADSGERAPDDVLQEIDFYLKLELVDDARRLAEDLMGQYPSDEQILARAAKLGLVAVPTGKETPSFESEVDEALEELFFEEAPEGEDASETAVDLSVGDSRGDPRAQYDLGLAYREMGMIEDAVAKFEQAYHLFSDAENPERAVLCSSMLAAGYLKMRNFGKTVEWADIGLSLPNMKEFEWKTLEYDRAYALEMMGELEESLTGYRRILGTDPHFRDVRSRLGRLDQSSI